MDSPVKGMIETDYPGRVKILIIGSKIVENENDQS